MQRQTYLIIGKTLGLAGILATISDLAQPLAPIATYMMGASAVSLIILMLTKIIAHIWNEKLAVSTYFTLGLFVLSSILYVCQIQSSEAAQHGVIASEISEFAELQRLLGLTTEQLEKIGRSVSSIDTQVANMNVSISSVDEHVKSINIASSSIDKKLDNLKQETSTDPRKELNNMGLSWQYDNFLGALRNKDAQAITLYLQGGMKLRSTDLTQFITDSYLQPIADMLIQQSAMADDVTCSGQISFYKNISENLEKTNFVRNICTQNIRQLIKKFDRLIDAQETQLDLQRTSNAQLETDRRQCVANLASVPAEEYVTEMQYHDYTKKPSPREQVLTRLKGNSKILKILAYKNVSATKKDNNVHEDNKQNLSKYYHDLEKDINKIIHKICITTYPDQNKKIINIDTLDQLRDDQRFLSEHYVKINKGS